MATTQYQAIHDISMQTLKNEVKQLHDVVEMNKGVEPYCLNIGLGNMTWTLNELYNFEDQDESHKIEGNKYW